MTTMKDCVGISMTEGLRDVSETTSVGDIERVSPIEDDAMAWLFVTDKKLLEFELELYASKWFDYRELTSFQATRLYMEAFGDAYRKHYRINIDRSAAEHIKPVTVEKVMKGLEESRTAPPADAGPQMIKERDKRIKKARTAFIGCWRGRQVADALGMPYDVYCDLAFEYRMNFWNRATMPQPTHLYSEMVVEKIQERWEELQARKLYLSDKPAYMVQNYAGIAHQDDYHEWLMKQAGMRANPPFFLAQFVDDDLLPLDKLEARYDEHVMERVGRYLLH